MPSSPGTTAEASGTHQYDATEGRLNLRERSAAAPVCTPTARREKSPDLRPHMSLPSQDRGADRNVDRNASVWGHLLANYLAAYLSMCDIARGSRVCRSWYQGLALRPLVWREALRNEFRIDVAAIERHYLQWAKTFFEKQQCHQVEEVMGALGRSALQRDCSVSGGANSTGGRSGIAAARGIEPLAQPSHTPPAPQATTIATGYVTPPPASTISQPGGGSEESFVTPPRQQFRSSFPLPSGDRFRQQHASPLHGSEGMPPLGGDAHLDEGSFQNMMMEGIPEGIREARRDATAQESPDRTPHRVASLVRDEYRNGWNDVECPVYDWKSLAKTVYRHRIRNWLKLMARERRRVARAHRKHEHASALKVLEKLVLWQIQAGLQAGQDDLRRTLALDLIDRGQTKLRWLRQAHRRHGHHGRRAGGDEMASAAQYDSGAAAAASPPAPRPTGRQGTGPDSDGGGSTSEGDWSDDAAWLRTTATAMRAVWEEAGSSSSLGGHNGGSAPNVPPSTRTPTTRATSEDDHGHVRRVANDEPGSTPGAASLPSSFTSRRWSHDRGSWPLASRRRGASTNERVAGTPAASLLGTATSWTYGLPDLIRRFYAPPSTDTTSRSRPPPPPPPQPPRHSSAPPLPGGGSVGLLFPMDDNDRTAAGSSFRDPTKKSRRLPVVHDEGFGRTKHWMDYVRTPSSRGGLSRRSSSSARSSLPWHPPWYPSGWRDDGISTITNPDGGLHAALASWSQWGELLSSSEDTSPSTTTSPSDSEDGEDSGEATVNNTTTPPSSRRRPHDDDDGDEMPIPTRARRRARAAAGAPAGGAAAQHGLPLPFLADGGRHFGTGSPGLDAAAPAMSHAAILGDFALALLVGRGVLSEMTFLECYSIAVELAVADSASAELFTQPCFDFDSCYDSYVGGASLSERAGFLFHIGYWRRHSFISLMHEYMLCDLLRMWPVAILRQAVATARTEAERQTALAWQLFDTDDRHGASNAAWKAIEALPYFCPRVECSYDAPEAAMKRGGHTRGPQCGDTISGNSGTRNANVGGCCPTPQAAVPTVVRKAPTFRLTLPSIRIEASLWSNRRTRSGTDGLVHRNPWEGPPSAHQRQIVAPGVDCCPFCGGCTAMTGAMAFAYFTYGFVAIAWEDSVAGYLSYLATHPPDARKAVTLNNLGTLFMCALAQPAAAADGGGGVDEHEASEDDLPQPPLGIDDDDDTGEPPAALLAEVDLAAIPVVADDALLLMDTDAEIVVGTANDAVEPSWPQGAASSLGAASSSSQSSTDTSPSGSPQGDHQRSRGSSKTGSGLAKRVHDEGRGPGCRPLHFALTANIAPVIHRHLQSMSLIRGSSCDACPSASRQVDDIRDDAGSHDLFVDERALLDVATVTDSEDGAVFVRTSRAAIRKETEQHTTGSRDRRRRQLPLTAPRLMRRMRRDVSIRSGDTEYWWKRSVISGRWHPQCTIRTVPRAAADATLTQGNAAATNGVSAEATATAPAAPYDWILLGGSRLTLRHLLDEAVDESAASCGPIGPMSLPAGVAATVAARGARRRALAETPDATSIRVSRPCFDDGRRDASTLSRLPLYASPTTGTLDPATFASASSTPRQIANLVSARWFQEAERHNPRYFVTYRNLVRCLLKLGRTDEARQALDTGIRQSMPHTPSDAFAERSKLVAMPSADLAIVAAMNPRSSAPFRYRAAVAMDRGAFDEALAEVDAIVALKLDPADLSLKAVLLRGQERMKEAVRCVQVCLTLDPHNETYLRWLEANMPSRGPTTAGAGQSGGDRGRVALRVAASTQAAARSASSLSGEDMTGPVAAELLQRTPPSQRRTFGPTSSPARPPPAVIAAAARADCVVETFM